jgi:WD40 repeat protein
MLASASKDATAMIWRVNAAGEAFHMHTLAGHHKAVAFLTWSPDDSRLLTCGSDNEVRAALPEDCHGQGFAQAASKSECMAPSILGVRKAVTVCRRCQPGSLLGLLWTHCRLVHVSGLIAL